MSMTVIPAKTGIQKIWCQADWMPAFAGMTEKTPRPLIYLWHTHQIKSKDNSDFDSNPVAKSRPLNKL
jgi:hypothetical protein